MAILKCKMCGGNLTVEEGMTVCECEYCGSNQTVPNVDDEKKINLFTRANRLRAACEFDKAFGVYESIIAEFQEEAEAYWGLVLCKYGIEYVDDPKTGKKIPTCHRSSFDSVLVDSNFELVMEYSDVASRAVYREEAKAIEELRVGIIEVSSKEEPYDIFICYKETDENGDRTIDSVLAQDVYDALVKKGYKVFFSRITLEDKLGQEYEPYIFAALNSAKVMLAFGTDYEYYNAVWVKNEWSRFLSLIEKGEKKILIPCYKDIDAYDMPAEFKKLQGQDMGKVGAIQDLLRGIEKIMPKKAVSASGSSALSDSSDGKIAPLLERVEIFLTDGEWKKADEYCEKILDSNPKNAQAYLGKLLIEIKARNLDEAKESLTKPMQSSSNYEKVIRFADEGLKHQVEAVADIQRQNIEEAEELKRKEEIYEEASKAFENAKSEEDYVKIIALFEKISGYKDADEKLHACKNASQEILYTAATKRLQWANSLNKLKRCVQLFETIKGYRDSDELAKSCRDKIQQIEEREKNVKGKSEEAFRQYQKAKEIASMEQELARCEQDLAKSNKEATDIEQHIPHYEKIFSQVGELNIKIENISSEIDRLYQRKKGLGIFAGKEKRTIDEQLNDLFSQQEDLNQRIVDCSYLTSPYSSIEDVKSKLDIARKAAEIKQGSVNDLQNKITATRSELGEPITESLVYNQLLDTEVLAYLMKKPKAKSLLETDTKVGSFINDHLFEVKASDYSVKNADELRKIEKWDLWNLPAWKVDKKLLDKRSEAKLMDDVEEYLLDADLLENYTIEREVPAEQFDADTIVKKYLGDMGRNSLTDEPFSANKYGRPASFVIKDSDNSIKMVIMIAKEGGFSHWLIKWCELWCKDKNVPFLRLYLGAPNTEHYVVRRVCQKMHIIESYSYVKKVRNPQTGEWMNIPKA